MTESLPRLPTEEEIQRAVDAIENEGQGKKPDVGSLALLEQLPGLARTDAEWYARYPDRSPLILLAIACRNYRFVRACLQKGSNPFALNGNGQTVVEQLLKTSLSTITCIEAVEALLEHPECSSLNVTDRMGNLMLSHAHHLFVVPAITEEQDQRRRNICRELIKRTPHELLAEKASLSEYLTPKGSLAASDEDSIFLIRTLVDYGADIDRVAPYTAHALENMEQHKQSEVAAALLAAGTDMATTVRRIAPEFHLGDYVSRLKQWGNPEQKQFIRQAEEGCTRILDEQIARMTVNREPPEKVLFTPEGRPSWQAQGLVMRGRIDEVLDVRHAALFGGAEQQMDFAVRLGAALTERQREHYKLVGLLRDTALAQPEDAVTVRYLRGESPAAGKGAA